MPRWIWIGGECHEVTDLPPPKVRVNVISDIQPYKSMVTGEMITSRSRHRDHLKAHGCIEVGNEKMGAPKPHAIDRMARRKALYQQLGDVSDREANKVLKELRRQYGR